MALPQAWTTISVGLKIVYDDHMLDLRTNADYLDNNVANRTHNTTLHTAQDVTADNDQYSTADNPHNSAADADQYATADNPYYGTHMNGHYPGYDGTAYTTNNNGWYPGYDPGHVYSHFSTAYTGNNGGNHSNCTTIYNSVDEYVTCGSYWTVVNSSYYGSNVTKG